MPRRPSPSSAAEQKPIELGQRAISRYGCFSCHEIKGFEKAQSIGTDLSEEGSKLVTRLDFAFITDIPHTSKTAWFRTKLHDPRIFDRGRVLKPEEKLRMPNFDFNDEEVDRLLTAIMSFQREIQPPAAMPMRSAKNDFVGAGRTLVHRRNCVGCHVIEGDGGDFGKMLADASLGPPMLTPEGARVQPDWLYAFLRGPITIRPWLNVRMPTFGLDDHNLNGVISYFGAVSNTVGPFQTHEIVRVANADTAGKQLFETLKCQQCHVLGAIPKDQPTANLAPDLRMAPDRLQPDWILEWLKKPSDILPGTRMPAFWADYPKSPFPQLNGDGEAQIRAIRDYLLTFKGGPTPRKNGSAPCPPIDELTLGDRAGRQGRLVRRRRTAAAQPVASPTPPAPMTRYNRWECSDRSAASCPASTPPLSSTTARRSSAMSKSAKRAVSG